MKRNLKIAILSATALWHAPAAAGQTARAVGPTTWSVGRGMVIALSSGGKLRKVQAHGLADRQSGQMLTPRSRFQIGSISKWFTAVLALRLVQEHRLDLDAPIGRYLDDYPLDVGSAVKVRDLLSNTSGIIDRLPTELINRPDVAQSTMSAAQAAHVYGTGPLRFKPGTDFDYSHTNWLLVQAIIERAGQAPFEHLLRSRVLEPLGLRNTGVTHGRFDHVTLHANAYSADGPDSALDLHVIPEFLVPTGTLYSNAYDLLRAVHLVYHGNFLKPAILRQLTTVRYPAEGYALGGRVRRLKIGTRWLPIASEVGSFGGFKAVVETPLSEDLGVVVLNNTNADEDQLTALADRLLVASLSRAAPGRR